MSLAATTTLVNTVTTDAAFRTWGSAYNAKWAAMGLVQTSDTGQINWTTVTAALAINTIQGYEVWRFNDALQSTAPVFIKMSYGSGASVNNGSITFQVGSGSNGTGGLTGVLSTAQQVQCTATVGAITHYWSGDTNRAAFAATGASAATSMFFSIERSVDASGALTSEACFLAYRGTSLLGQQGWNTVTGPTTATWETSFGAMGPSLAPFGTFGTEIAIYPVFYNKGVFFPPGYAIHVYENILVTANSPVTFTVYGGSHTYMPLGSANFGSAGRGGFSAPALMMRYE